MRRTLPLLALVAGITAFGAPVAFYVVSTQDLKQQGRVLAGDLAATLRVEAQTRPVLWRYDSAKVLEHLTAFRLQRELLEIRVYDTHDRLIAQRHAEYDTDALVWAAASIGGASDASVGEVWVAMSLDRARVSALGLLAPFVALGLFLCWLLFVLPRRALSHAEQENDEAFRQLRESRAELSELSASLESQVAAQVEELQRAYDELRAQEARLRKLAANATSAQDEERRSIGRDLHDAAGQVLTAIRLNLQRLAKKRDEPDQVAKLTEVTLQHVDDVMEEIRRVLAALGPAVVSELGLRGALERHCHDVASWAPFELVSRFSSPEDARVVPAAVETACYRVAQEAITNVVRHAEASKVVVELQNDDNGIRLMITDDGVGLSEPASREGQGIGLSSMRERVELLGGRFELDSTEDGTRVTATFESQWLGESQDASA